MIHRQHSQSSQFIHDYFLYNEKLLPGIDLNFFSPDFWRKEGMLRGQAQGRGNAFAIDYGQKHFFLRHYRRGGMIAPLMQDKYVWTGLNSTRAWREFSLLQVMYAKGLPVPRPVAAHVQQIGPVYRADIVTEKIEYSLPLSNLMAQEEVEDDLWIKIGICLRRFHLLGIVHADLNAHNILIDANESIWLIDFDKGVWNKPKAARQQSNLHRLRKSLAKVWPQSQSHQAFNRAWKLLLHGYYAD